MRIEVEVKTVYGNQTIIPHCKTAKLFAQLLGQKTLTSSDVKTIKQLGYTVEVVQAPVTL